ncbi:MAG: AbrB/MazE/SpoVT family DNA-binding domain-containing protein [Candidatus Omnitrophica bacterium]|nr:AbrB/MazE/SpoVT family DNA-binding domain-containing protein [Candidatus Omnitrophota bacterium]
MKRTGITRPVDELGRVVIPKELRDEYDWGEHDMVEIFTDSDNIILHKYQKECVFCKGIDGLQFFKGKLTCKHCRIEMP